MRGVLLVLVLGPVYGSMVLCPRAAHAATRHQETAYADTIEPLGPGISLEEALQAALRLSPSIEDAEAAAAAAASARWADWGAFLPTAQASASLSSNHFSNLTFVAPEGVSRTLPDPVTGTRKSSSQSLSFGLTVFDLNRFTQLKAGGARAHAADLRLTLAERTLIRDVKRAWYESVKQARLAQVAERQLEARREEFEITRARYRIAAVGRNDLLGAEISVAEAELQLLDASGNTREAARALRVLIGRPPDLAADVGIVDPDAGMAPGAGGAGADRPDADAGRPEADEPYPVTPDTSLTLPALPDAAPLDADALARRALGNHPELAALEAEASAASAQVWGSRFSWLPQLTAGFSLSRDESLGPRDPFFVFDPRNTNRGFSLRASWDLFAGFDRTAQMAEASGALRRAEAQRSQRALEIAQAVRDLVDRLQRQDLRLGLLERSYELKAERLDLTREEYRLGTVQYFDLQRAIGDLTAAEQALFQARYDYLTGWAELEFLVGDAPAGDPSSGDPPARD